jgi:hypothetical protein
MDARVVFSGSSRTNHAETGLAREGITSRAMRRIDRVPSSLPDGTKLP